MRKVKTICTIGPASASDEIVTKLMLAGMDAARLNFSHGTYKSHADTVARLQRISKAHNRPLAILQDIQGPRIRLGTFAGGQANLRTGEAFVLTTRPLIGDDFHAHVQVPNLYKDVKKGDRILVADGSLQLRVTEVEGRDIITRIVIGGVVKDHSGINLPGVHLSAATITEKDKRDIRFGQRLGVDIIAVSFVRSPEDVLIVRRMIHKARQDTLVLAKIEHPDALSNLDEILDVCDGVMLARGDLGVELPPKKFRPFKNPPSPAPTLAERS